MTSTIGKGLLAASITACLGLSGSAFGQLTTSNPGTPQDVEILGGGLVVLFDQTDNDSGNGAPDQNFEAAYDVYDAEGADDFLVSDPEGWMVEAVDIVGTQSAAGPAASVTITFYTDNGGVPGTPVCTYPDITPVETAGSFMTALPTACALSGNTTYWMAHQTNQDFATAGQHFWSNRTVQTGNPAVWRNPGDGFATGCIDFTAMTTCGVGGGTNPDFLFALRGTIGGGLPEPTAVPALNVWGVGALGLLLLVGSGMMLRRRRV